ncbi:hypothetical protein [Gemmobacter serpentinus]|uniref:hypothetical protein n=1 Tax=Gemmobacter serpentinus TaxID=2652247 RepID=UPI00385154B0
MPVNAPGALPNGLMPEKETMPSTAKCSTLPPVALLIVTLWLTGCATAGSETRAPCPPVVEYSSGNQARAADEVEALPEGAVIVRMLSDYAVLRDQARACR